MNKLSTAILLSGLVLSGAAFAQNSPNQSAVNSDASKPNSPFKNKGMPDAGAFNPTGPGAAPRVAPAPAPVAAPAPAPVVAAPAPAPVAAPAPAPMPAPAPAPRPARADRG